MRRKTRKQINRVLLILALIFVIVILAVVIVVLVKLSKKPPVSYDDVLVGKNYFKEITIDLSKSEVKRDGKKTKLQKEFDISEEEENSLFTSEEQLMSFLSKSSFSVSFPLAPALNPVCACLRHARRIGSCQTVSFAA